MQNLTADLLPEIQQKQRISLPSADAKFNWVDADNVGEVTAVLLHRFDEYKNQAFEITGNELLNFDAVTNKINAVLNTHINYRSVNPFHFFYLKLKEGKPFAKVVVMFVLHFLPRFEKAPAITNNYQMLSGKEPTTLNEFIAREASKFSV